MATKFGGMIGGVSKKESKTLPEGYTLGLGGEYLDGPSSVNEGKDFPTPEKKAPIMIEANTRKNGKINETQQDLLDIINTSAQLRIEESKEEIRPEVQDYIDKIRIGESNIHIQNRNGIEMAEIISAVRKGISPKACEVVMEISENTTDNKHKEEGFENYSLDIRENEEKEGDVEKTVTIETQNYCLNKDIEIIKKRVQEANEELKTGTINEKYMEILKNGNYSNKGRGGFGIIAIVNVAQSELDVKFEKINNEISIVKMSIKAPKKQKKSEKKVIETTNV